MNTAEREDEELTSDRSFPPLSNGATGTGHSNRRLLVVALAAVLLTPANIFSCGPFWSDAIFVPKVRPAPPLENFLAGHLGVVQPKFNRVYLAIAYRYLSGKPVDQAQLAQLPLYWATGEQADEALQGAHNDWNAASAAATGTPPAPRASADTDWFSPVPGGQWERYLNCTADAFQNAALTVKARAQQFGIASAVMRDWVSAQDAVFSNCTGPADVPQVASPSSPELIRADRAYQIAAAHFYRGEYQEAQSGFDAIASDSNSPWRTLAPYLAARSLVRQGTMVTPKDQPFDAKVLAEAAVRLNAIIENPQLKLVHAAARRELSFVLLRIQPEEQAHVLALRISGDAGAKSGDNNLGQDLIDYTRLLDRLLTPDAQPNDPGYTGTAPPQELAELKRADDLTDWILTMQDASDAARAHALERWRQSHTVSWLIASLAESTAATTRPAELMELLRAASEVPPTSPAYDSATYNRARLLTESGTNNEARSLIDEQLQRLAPNAIGTRNLYLELRFPLATSLAELLKLAPRVPFEIAGEGDGNRFACTGEKCGASDTYWGTTKVAPLFDLQSAATLNQRLPTPVLVQAVESSTLPAKLHDALSVATWSRAAILGDSEAAKALAPAVSKVAAGFEPYAAAYNSAADDAARKFAAAFALLHYPGMRAYVDAGEQRSEALAKIDELRDNWWCLDVGAVLSEPNYGKLGWQQWQAETWNVQKQAFESSKDNNATEQRSTPSIAPEFLTAEQRKSASAEWMALQKIGSAPNYFGEAVLPYAKAHPEDPRVPEALHLVVRATRLGCWSSGTPEVSRQAFNLLHQHYPDSPWTKQTPYWFKN